MSLTNPRFVFICLLILYSGFSPSTALPSVDPSQQSPGLTVRLDPAIQDVEPGHSFTISVVVDGAVDLGAFQFDLIYDPAVVTVTHVELGPFLGSTSRTVQSVGPDIDNLVGVVTFGAFSLGSRAGPEGGGLLASLTFTAAGPGTSILNLQNVLLTDTLANVQSASVKDGTVTVSAPAPTSTPTMTPSQTMPPTATPTKTAEPVSTVMPTYTATAKTPSETATAPSAPPVASETTTPVPTPVPTPTKPLTATPAVTTTPAVTPVPTPTELLTSTLAETPQPDVAVTGVLSPTPGAVSPRTPAFTPRLLESPTATVGAVESPLASPVPSSSATAVWSNPLCWLSVGGTFLFVAGCVFYALLRRRGA